MYEYDIEGKRILEVGCGIAMASLVLNHRSANITATDYHPEAEKFLIENVKLNKGKHIPFFLLDWEKQKESFGEFDLIIGSDLLYEPDHAALLSEFIETNASKNCEVIIVDPGRNKQNRFTKKMQKLSFTHSKTTPETKEYLAKPFLGVIHKYTR